MLNYLNKNANDDVITSYIKKIIGSNRGKRIVIEGSEPLIHRLNRLVDKLDLHENTEVMINLDIRYGACDIDFGKYSVLGFEPDIVIHIGHNPFPGTFESIRKLNYKVYFLPVIEDIDSNKMDELYSRINMVIKPLKEDHRVIVLYSIQYKKYADKLSRLLKDDGYSIVIPKTTGLLNGQILGCTLHGLRNHLKSGDLIIVVSSGMFHALGVSLYTGKKTFLVDPHNIKIADLYGETVRTRNLIAWNLYRARNYRKAGVISVSDSFQAKIGGFSAIIKLLEENGWTYKTYSVNRVSEYLINNLPDDELPVIAGCPRIAIDDITRFKRPVLNFEQLQILFGVKSFDDVYPAPEVI